MERLYAYSHAVAGQYPRGDPISRERVLGFFRTEEGRKLVRKPPCLHDALYVDHPYVVADGCVRVRFARAIRLSAFLNVLGSELV
eukprot:1383442-Amorphochlora_amoeboformis.AAC.1